jgi:hypothetical protein
VRKESGQANVAMVDVRAAFKLILFVELTVAALGHKLERLPGVLQHERRALGLNIMRGGTGHVRGELPESDFHGGLIC